MEQPCCSRHLSVCPTCPECLKLVADAESNTLRARVSYDLIEPPQTGPGVVRCEADEPREPALDAFVF